MLIIALYGRGRADTSAFCAALLVREHIISGASGDSDLFVLSWRQALNKSNRNE
jgi:hypothetical protein